MLLYVDLCFRTNVCFLSNCVKHCVWLCFLHLMKRKTGQTNAKNINQINIMSSNWVSLHISSTYAHTLETEYGMKFIFFIVYTSEFFLYPPFFHVYNSGFFFCVVVTLQKESCFFISHIIFAGSTFAVICSFWFCQPIDRIQVLCDDVMFVRHTRLVINRLFVRNWLTHFTWTHGFFSFSAAWRFWDRFNCFFFFHFQ